MIKREWWEILETRLSIEKEHFFKLSEMGFGSEDRFEAVILLTMQKQKSKTYKSFLSNINQISKNYLFQDLEPYVREILQDVDRAIIIEERMDVDNENE